MLNFATKHFRTLVEVILWINFVSFVIAGLIFGNQAGDNGIFGYGNKELGVLIGVILGIVTGLLINIICGGLIGVFLNIDKGVKNTNKWLQCIWESHINTDANQKGLPKPISDDDIYYFYSKIASNTPDKDSSLS